MRSLLIALLSIAFMFTCAAIVGVADVNLWAGKVYAGFTLAAQGFFVLMLVASFVVRVTPGKKDDEAVAAFYKRVHGWLAYCPTLGKNPRTALLEKTLEEIQATDNKK